MLKIYCIDGKKTKLKIKGSWTIKKSQELFREDYWHLQPHLIYFLPCSGSRGLPSPPCEGDRDQKWSDLGSVACFRFLSFSLLIFLFCLLLATRSDVSEPPPPPLSSPTFCFTSFSSNRVLYGWDLLEAWMVRAFNRLSLFCRHVCSFPMGVEIFYGCGCLVGIEFGDFFQFEILLTTLSLG